VYPAPDIAVAYQDFYPRVKITRSDQPSLRCYAAHYTLDYLSVRGRQNKKADRGIQIFLPELVRTFVLPSGVYSQAFMMPSIIHRIHRFLIAMGLGAKIANSSLSLKRKFPLFTAHLNYSRRSWITFFSFCFPIFEQIQLINLGISGARSSLGK